MKKIGITSWDEVENPNKQNKQFNKEDWLKLSNGSNEVRVLTRPARYLVHKYKIAGTPGFGSNIRCTTDSQTCPLCKAGVQVSERFLLGVIDRSTETYKILDVGPKLAQDLKAQNSSPKWGPLLNYDVNILVDKHGGATGYYRVQPNPATPLSEKDKQLLDKVDQEDLVRRCSPSTPEKVLEQMNKEKSKAAGSGGGGMRSRETISSESEEDFQFPSVN